ncbi:MAG: glycoside hydrolase family 3 C-terminal domain-containing protein, partial [Lewinella sp.]|nr:glycoside hydrolase family 3 C-terminal domain-containing protein [Lewinella sp.]
YLPPFRAAHDAGVATYMTSFNELDGVPASANEHLLRDILREEWGFRGFVVTDYTSINEMVPHGYARDDAHAGLLAAQAGVDMDMQGDVYHRFLADQVRSGQISEMVVNEAVRNILRMKAALGLFDDPYRYSDTERQERYVFSDEHRAAARDMARRSFVLLKNEAEALPLSAGDLSRLAVIGPLADSQADMLGAWHADGQASECVTLLTGLRERLGRGVRVDYARGCSATDDNDADIAAALRVARRADVIVLAVGEPAWMSGEAASRSELDLPGKQEELVAALSALGKPLVVVLFNGRPLAIPGVIDAADAVLEAWYPGTEAGRAVTDVLFGDYNPAGKLPVTFPRSVGQVPIFYAAKNTGRPMDPNNKYTSKYLDVPNTPLFPFGYGLSYTSFTFSELAVDKTSFAPHESVRVSVTVTNTGDRAGEEVVQLYVRDLVGSATRPLRELKAFSKVELAPGASTRLTFTLDVNDLAFYTQSGEWAAEPGDFEVFVGGSSEADLSTTFTLTE